MRNTLRHKLSSSMATLPATVVLASAMWLAADCGRDSAGGLLATLLLTYVLMELVNRNQLMRVRSRLISASFLALATTAQFLHGLSTTYVPAFCLLAAYFLLFRSYQKPRAEGEAFYAFLALGTGALVFPPFVLLAPVFYFCMGVQLRTLTWRTLTAGLFGLAVPAWAYAIRALWRGEAATAFDFVLPYIYMEWPPCDYAQVPLWQWVNAAFLGALIFLGLLHYYRTNFNDKIRVRMCYYVIICVEVLLMAGLCLLPRHFEQLYLLLLVNSAPLVGHYFTLARGKRLMDLWMILWLAAIVALWLFNSPFLHLPWNS